MTVKDLYEWAKENNAEELDIRVQYRDSGGYYTGTDSMIEPEIDNDCGETFVLL